MSVTTRSAAQKPSILAAFQTAPTLVKVLASILYAVGLLTLIQMAMSAAGGGLIVPQDQVVAVMLDLFELVVALVAFLLGKGITRGSYGSWLATLIFTVFFGVQQSVQVILTAVSVVGVGSHGRRGCPHVATHARRPPALPEEITLLDAGGASRTTGGQVINAIVSGTCGLRDRRTGRPVAGSAQGWITRRCYR